MLDEHAIGELRPGRRAHLMADGKHPLAFLRCAGLFGLVELQPQAFGALLARQEFGFGQVGDGRYLSCWGADARSSDPPSRDRSAL